MVGAGRHLLFEARVLLLRLLKRGLGFSWHGSFHQNGRQCSEVAQSRATSVPEKRGQTPFSVTVHSFPGSCLGTGCSRGSASYIFSLNAPRLAGGACGAVRSQAGAWERGKEPENKVMRSDPFSAAT